MSASRVLSLVLTLSWCLSMPLTARTSWRRPASRSNEYLGKPKAELRESFANEALRKRSNLEDTLHAAGNGVKEEIPAKYRKRYQDWKNEFLATETGRAQWQAYAEQSQFTLIITISHDNRNGGGTGKYKWDDSGHLSSATITLGCRMDEGYPGPVYYPVMNSLSPRPFTPGVGGSVLAATKLAHEFGHVNRMAKTDGALYRQQTKLIPVYNSILQSNGHKANDPRLTALAQQMGGTPMEIWSDREYWGEANAMLYLRDRMARESYQCALFNRIKRQVELYARKYEERFVQVAQSTSPPYRCTWQ